MAKMKKGQIEFQFNWVFVFIIGAIIVIFFTTLVFKMKENSDLQTNIAITSELETIFQSTVSSTDSSTLIELTKTEIEYDCNGFTVDGVKIDSVMAFSPSPLITEELLTFSLDWSFPFKVQNIFYMTTPDVRYVFIGNSVDFEPIIDMLPNGTNFDMYGYFSDIDNKNNYKIKVISTSIGNPVDIVNSDMEFCKDRDYDCDFVEVDLIDGVNRGTFEINDDGDVINYFSKEFLLGGILSEDSETYRCNTLLALEKYQLLVELYSERSSKIRDHYVDFGDECGQYFTEAINSLNAIDSVLNSVLANQNITAAQVINMRSNMLSLKENNRQIKVASCAWIY